MIHREHRVIVSTGRVFALYIQMKSTIDTVCVLFDDLDAKSRLTKCYGEGQGFPCDRVFF